MRLLLIVPPTGKVARKQTVTLADGEILEIGGASDCGAVIDDPSVGTARVRLERSGEWWTVQDLEGLGKCVVGGVPLRARVRRILRPPLSLWLGNVECRLELDLPLDGGQSTGELALGIVDAAGGAASVAPVIRIAEGKRMGEAITLARGEPRIVGRGNDVALFLESPEVSRHHLSVEWRGERVLVTDHGSTGGTYLGRARLQANRAAVWPPTRMVACGKVVLLLEATTGELLGQIAPPSFGEVAAVANGIEKPASEAAAVAVSRGPQREASTGADACRVADPGASAASMTALPRAGIGAPDPGLRGLRWATVTFVMVALTVITATGWLLFVSD